MVIGRTPVERAEAIALNNIKIAALEAVTAAKAAVVAAQIAEAKVDLFNSAEQFVFPEKTDEFCLLTAGGPANTFGAWAGIVDNNAVALSSKFVSRSGYLTELTLHIFSVANQKYLVEIAFSAGANVIARIKCYSDWTYVLAVRSEQIPAGATLVYRMMAETAGATCRADFRYIYG